MNLLYVTEQDIRNPGGARTHVVGFLEGMQANGVTTRLVAPFVDWTGEPDAITVDREIAAGKNMLEKLIHLGRLVSLRNNLIDIFEDSSGYDLIYYRMGPFNPGFLHAVNGTQCPVVLEVNGLWDWETEEWWRHPLSVFRRPIDRRCFAAADGIIAVSPGVKEGLLQRYDLLTPSDIKVVHNGVRANLFYPRQQSSCRETLGIANKRSVLLFVGRLAARHGVEWAIRATVSLVEEGRTDILLLIVGEGPASKELKRVVPKDYLGSNIRFVGPVQQQKVARFIGAADVCLAPYTNSQVSETGTSALKMWEYLACNRPVVAGKVKGIKEVIREAEAEELIRLVEPENVRDLKTGIKATVNKVSASSGEYFGAKSERCEVKFSWTERCKEIIDCADNIAASSSGSWPVARGP